MMVADIHSETLPYRLLITRRKASEILISTVTLTWSLPSFLACRNERLAQQITAAVHTLCSLRVYCLWSRRPSTSNGASFHPYAVLEAVNEPSEPPSGMSWVPLGEAIAGPGLASSDQELLLNLRQELDRHAAAPEVAPFAQPGWIHDLFAWVEPHIEPFRFTREFDQLQASPTFSLIRIETTGIPVWFKATGEPNAHERAVTLALKRQLPDFLPHIIAAHPRWQGWLSEEVQGRTLDLAVDAADWIRAAAELARMQIASCDKVHELVQSGCKELNLAYLASQIAPFLERMSELMVLQPSEPPQILHRSEIRGMGRRLKRACEELEQCGWPDTLGHLDPNPRNILATRDGCVFLDWAEGYIGHPLFTFEYLAEHARRNLPERDANIERAYAREWKSFVSLDRLSRSLALSPLVAVFAYAVADPRWHSPNSLTDPAAARFFRSLTRRAYREVRNLRTRSNPCPA